jgi:predicted AlkP superfamily phosphohydrolase/phosphomutase
MHKPKVMVIGLDGATFDVIKPLAAQGYLPNFSKIIKEGCHGPLESVIHPGSAQAWASFLTGKKPGKHGIFDFFVRRKNEYNWRPTGSMDLGTEALWDIFNRFSVRSAFLFVPMTYPVRQLDGVMISGFGTPGADSDFVYPFELKGQLTKKFSKRSILEMITPRGLNEKTYFNKLTENMDVQVKILDFITDNHAFDFIAYVFGQTDRVQHFYWPKKKGDVSEEIKDFYVKVDSHIGKIMRKFEGANFVFLSDHGFGPCKKDIYINNWLNFKGYLKYRDKKIRPKNIIRIILKQIIILMRKKLNRGVVIKLKPFLPRWLYKRLYSLGLIPLAADIDWKHTRAYSLGSTIGGNIFLNLEGREPLGTVAQCDKADLLNRIKDDLKGFKDPETGEALIAETHFKESLYQGPYQNKSPDLVFTLRDETYAVKPEYRGNRISLVESAKESASHGTEMLHKGNHRMDGIFMSYGPAIKAGRTIAGAKIVDLAPTILALLGLPALNDMDGRVLEEILDEPQRNASMPASYSRHKPGEFTPEEEAAISNNLRELGYL